MASETPGRACRRGTWGIRSAVSRAVGVSDAVSQNVGAIQGINPHWQFGLAVSAPARSRDRPLVGLRRHLQSCRQLGGLLGDGAPAVVDQVLDQLAAQRAVAQVLRRFALGRE